MSDIEHIKGENQPALIALVNEIVRGYVRKDFYAASTTIVVHTNNEGTGIEIIGSRGYRSRFYVPKTTDPSTKHLQATFEAHTRNSFGKHYTYYPTGEYFILGGRWINATTNRDDGQNFDGKITMETIDSSETYIRQTKIHALLKAIEDLDYD